MHIDGELTLESTDSELVDMLSKLIDELEESKKKNHLLPMEEKMIIGQIWFYMVLKTKIITMQNNLQHKDAQIRADLITQINALTTFIHPECSALDDEFHPKSECIVIRQAEVIKLIKATS